MSVLTLDGRSLSVEALSRAAREDWQVSLDPSGLALMDRTHALVADAVRDRVPVYGVTTGLGARVNEVLDGKALSEFSVQTLRGRAHAVGDAAPPEVVRAALLVRLNTFLTGHSAARPEVARHVAACLNAGLLPVAGQTGSIGAGSSRPSC